MNVALVKTPTPKGRPYDIYHLHITDPSGVRPEQKILVADLSQSGGGFRLRKWKIQKRDGRRVLRVYLETSIMGHDLDQWVTYDLETGERIE